MNKLTRRKIDKAVKTIANTAAPDCLVRAVEEVASDPMMSGPMSMTMDRMDAFTSPAAAIFAGVALNESARRMIDQVLDDEWARNGRLMDSNSSDLLDDIVIGSGPHAAIYAAAKVASGGRRPLVLEKAPRAGGSFAVTKGPAWFLNSRNRPGALAAPGVGGRALNVLPTAPMQPVDLGGSEYQTNDQLAFATRVTLALSATVATGIDVESVVEEYNDEIGLYTPFVRYNAVGFSRSRRVRYVVIATGLGKERRTVTAGVESDAILTYSQFMSKMDDPAPLSKMGRVAVIGSGDGGKTVIEALIGQGPRSDLMVPALGYPEVIEWYGVSGDDLYDDSTGETTTQRLRAGWERCNRSRYRGIGRALPRFDGDDTARVRAYGRASTVVDGFDSVFVNGRPYDTVIEATGYDLVANDLTREVYGPLGINSYGGRVLDRAYNPGGVTGVRVVGPAADLAVEPYEQQTTNVNVAENNVALWRYADRTATTARLIAETVR